MLLLMLVAGAGTVAAAAISGEAWPLFLIWPAYALAIPLARERDGPAPGEGAET